MADQDWSPPGSVAADSSDWEPPGARIPVRAHGRRSRSFLRQLAQSQARALPAYGAAAGGALGLLGGPAAVGTSVGGAMLGAAAGKALEQAISPAVGLEAPSGLLEAYGQQAGSAATEGALQGTGLVAGKAIGAAGSALARSQMSRALRPAVGLVRNFPQVVEHAIRQRATVNPWFGKGGAKAAEQVRRDATGRVVGLLRAAAQRGESIPIEDVAEPAIRMVEKKAGKLLGQERLDLLMQVQDRADELLLSSVLGSTQRSSRTMSPQMADELRKAAARRARSTLREESAGLPVTALPDLDRLIAQGAAQAVRRLQGVASARSAEQAAIGVSRAVREAELRPAPADVRVGAGPVHAGFGLPPWAASRLAITSAGLGHPLLGPLLANLLRAGNLGRESLQP